MVVFCIVFLELRLKDIRPSYGLAIFVELVPKFAQINSSQSHRSFKFLDGDFDCGARHFRPLAFQQTKRKQFTVEAHWSLFCFCFCFPNSTKQISATNGH